MTEEVKPVKYNKFKDPEYARKYRLEYYHRVEKHDPARHVICDTCNKIIDKRRRCKHNKTKKHMKLYAEQNGLEYIEPPKVKRERTKKIPPVVVPLLEDDEEDDEFIIDYRD